MDRKKNVFLTVLRISLPILITLLWLGFIYSNSLKDGKKSGEQSGKVHEIVNDVAQSVGVEEPISERTVRKSAHFTEFAVLGMLLCADLVCFGVITPKRKLCVSCLLALTAVPSAALFASVDEILQNFSEGRGPSVIDVLIDTSGAAAATVIFIVCFVLTVFTLRKIGSKKKYLFDTYAGNTPRSRD